MKNLLFYSPQFAGVAREIISLRGEDIELGQISFETFPDGAPNTRVLGVKDLVTRDVSFLMCLNDLSKAFEQISAHIHIARKAPRSYRVILPYFVTGTMERSNNQDEVITAQTLLAMLGSHGSGRIPLYTYDVHALAIESFGGSQLTLRFKTGLKLLFKEIERRADRSRIVLAFPDEGAYKRFSGMDAFVEAKERLGFSLAVCEKRRTAKGKFVTLKEGDVKDKDVIIVDDLVRTFGTQLACARLMRDEDAATVAAFATHVSGPEEGWKLVDGKVIDHLYMTNSCPMTAAAVAGNPYITVFNLAASFGDAIVEGTRR